MRSQRDAKQMSDIQFDRTVPIFRIFDEQKAMEFYVDFLGFALDWEHRFEEDSPLYAQVSRAGMILHLSEHHGDASPGSAAFITMHNIRAFQQELLDRHYAYMKPAVEERPWGLVMNVTDPFSNCLRFCQQSTG
tara:strand:- start:11485 stop:11886 length:402 start_codon:yes stop_codon:yes gene_type:complete